MWLIGCYNTRNASRIVHVDLFNCHRLPIFPFVCMQLGSLYWQDRECGCLLLQGGEGRSLQWVLRRTSEWGLLDHCDRPLHPTQQDRPHVQLHNYYYMYSMVVIQLPSCWDERKVCLPVYRHIPMVPFCCRLVFVDPYPETMYIKTAAPILIYQHIKCHFVAYPSLIPRDHVRAPCVGLVQDYVCSIVTSHHVYTMYIWSTKQAH